MSEKLVTLRRFLWPYEAEQAQALLRGYGIRSLMPDGRFLSWQPHLSVALGGVRLQVAESDAVAAEDILKTAFLEEEVRCPRCGSAIVKQGWPWWVTCTLLLGAVLIPLIIFGLLACATAGVRLRGPRIARRCGACGLRWKSGGRFSHEARSEREANRTSES